MIEALLDATRQLVSSTKSGSDSELEPKTRKPTCCSENQRGCDSHMAGRECSENNGQLNRPVKQKKTGSWRFVSVLVNEVSGLASAEDAGSTVVHWNLDAGWTGASVRWDFETVSICTRIAKACPDPTNFWRRNGSNTVSSCIASG